MKRGDDVMVKKIKEVNNTQKKWHRVKATDTTHEVSV